MRPAETGRRFESRLKSATGLVFLAFFGLTFLALFLALVVLALHFAVRIELVAPLLAILVDDGFVIGTLFFPANDFAATGFFVGGLLNRGRHVRAADFLLFVMFLSTCLGAYAEGESGANQRNSE